MRCLVTGGTGLLGNNIVRQLIDRGEQVRVMSQSAAASKALAGLEVERVECDICDETELAKAMQGVEVVYHSAAVVRIGWTGADDLERVNVKGAECVARAAMAQNARMLHVSSVNAIGMGWWDRPATEEESNAKIMACPYVDSKRKAAEKMEELVELENADIVQVLPGYMLGPWDWKPSSGELLLDVACSRLVATPTGGISLSDARDVAHGAISAADKGVAGRQYILAGHNISLRKAWTKFAALTNRRVPLMPLGPIARFIGGAGGDFVTWARGQEPLVNSASIGLSKLPHFFSSERAVEELGYSIRPVDEIIQDAWDWFVSHGYTKQPR